MLYSSAASAAPELARFLGWDGQSRPHVLIITHVNPDGDAVGSLVGLGVALESAGHKVSLLTPTPRPDFVANIPHADRVQSFSENPALPDDVDVVILVDTGDVRRIARVWDEAQAYLLARPLAVIDHHVTNTGEGAVNFVDPTRSSTCELIYELLNAWKLEITPPIATALLFGVITDTQSFRTSNTTPSALRTAAGLLELGADRDRIVYDVYHNFPISTARLMGHALLALQHDERIVWTHVSHEMQVISQAGDDAAGEVTDYLSSLGGYAASVMFKERWDGSVKVSFRSRPPVDVSVVAQEFGGGGHRQAAGCTLHVPLAEAEDLVLRALRAALDS